MKRSLFPALVLATVLAGSASAYPLQWQDGDSGTPLWTLTKWNPTYAGGFDLTLDGFNPDTMLIEQAFAYFAFADDGDWQSEEVDIFLGDTKVENNLEVDGSHWNAPESYDWIEINLLEEGLLASLQDDGSITFSIQLQNLSSKPDAYVKVAKLIAKGSELPPPVVSVPETGSTSLLVGAVFAGLIALRRRFRQSA